MGPSETWSQGRNFLRIPQAIEGYRPTGVLRQRRTIHPDLSLQQVPDLHPAGFIKKQQGGRQQYNPFTKVALFQPFHQATTMEDDRKPKTAPQPQNARQTKRLEADSFHCNKPCHMQTECRQRDRDAEHGMFRTRESQQNTEDHKKVGDDQLNRRPQLQTRKNDKTTISRQSRLQWRQTNGRRLAELQI